MYILLIRLMLGIALALSLLSVFNPRLAVKI